MWTLEDSNWNNGIVCRESPLVQYLNLRSVYFILLQVPFYILLSALFLLWHKVFLLGYYSFCSSVNSFRKMTKILKHHYYQQAELWFSSQAFEIRLLIWGTDMDAFATIASPTDPEENSEASLLVTLLPFFAHQCPVHSLEATRHTKWCMLGGWAHCYMWAHKGNFGQLGQLASGLGFGKL